LDPMGERFLTSEVPLEPSGGPTRWGGLRP